MEDYLNNYTNPADAFKIEMRKIKDTLGSIDASFARSFAITFTSISVQVSTGSILITALCTLIAAITGSAIINWIYSVFVEVIYRTVCSIGLTRLAFMALNRYGDLNQKYTTLVNQVAEKRL